MRLYNTLTRTIQDFEPLDRKTVRMYVCGPTVYDDPHIGHARSAYIFDVLRRYLEYKKFTVTFVRNVTDVDDKIIQKARHQTSDIRHQTQELTEQCREVAEHYLKRYHETMDRLGIGRPTHEPLATGHIDDMVNLISQLVVNGSAYETKTGDVYFSVRKFPGYGKLSNRSIDELQVGTRIEPGEQKQDPLDFALWKSAKPDEPAWESPWGKGRPGWHIECSAMSTKYLGDAFDIHGGGVDLVFPHHENEIAQAQAVGKKFARFWIHNGLLTVNGEKMSKSLSNFITVDQALKECFNKADALKMFFLGAHYRRPIDYTTENVLAANRRLNGWVAFLDRAATYRKKIDSNAASQEVQELEGNFVKAMDDDLNTPEALAVIDKLANWGYQQERKTLLSMKPSDSEREPRYRPSSERPTLEKGIVDAGETMLKLGRTLGLLERHDFQEAIPSGIRVLVAERQVARSEKNFQRADELRKKIEGEGFIIDDTSGEPIVRRKR